MTDWVMKRVNGDGIEIQLAVKEGKGNGKIILCIHGLTANSRCWEVMASGLAPAHTILAMDLRGRGFSDKPSTGYSLQHHIRDIFNLLENLDLDQAVLMGHSLGAYISLAFASHYPERTDRVVLIDAGGQLTQDEWAEVDIAIKPSLDRLGQVFPSFEAYIENLKQAPILQPWSREIEDYFRYESEDVDGGVRSRIDPAHIQEERQNITRVVPSEYYSKVTCPVLILRATDGIWNRNDLVLPEAAVKRMVSEIPDARRMDLKGTNHYSIVLQPNAERDQAILDFLKEP